MGFDAFNLMFDDIAFNDVLDLFDLRDWFDIVFVNGCNPATFVNDRLLLFNAAFCRFIKPSVDFDLFKFGLAVANADAEAEAEADSLLSSLLWDEERWCDFNRAECGLLCVTLKLGSSSEACVRLELTDSSEGSLDTVDGGLFAFPRSLVDISIGSKIKIQKKKRKTKIKKRRKEKTRFGCKKESEQNVVTSVYCLCS